MTTRFIEHVAAEGERWDQIAARYYGDPMRYEAVIMANPFVPITAVLDAGTRVYVPVTDEEPELIADVGLPPWKR